jgi:predicted Zn-dependent peptidase
MSQLESTVLKNGVRIVTDRWPDARSVSLGIWIRAGSRDEPRHLSGVSHFLEHLLAKGTSNRSGEEIGQIRRDGRRA